MTGLTWQRAGVAAAWLCVVVGAVMAGLWLARSAWVAERLPVLFLMQFNTAVTFVLTGLAFAALLGGARAAAFWLAVAVMVVALAFLIEPLLSSGHPLDRLVVDPFVLTAPRPGHLASGTALSFLLVGTGILVSAATDRPTLVRVILGATVFMAAAATLLGYGLQLVTENRWPPYGYMSPQTAFCFAAIALPMIFLRVEELGYHRSTIAATLGAASYLLLLLLTLFDLSNTYEAGMPADMDRPDSQAILAGLLVFSGIVYAGLIVYAFRNAQRYRSIASRLRESQQRLTAIIDTAVDGIITIDARGRILSANRATETIFGYTNKEMLGRNIRMLIPEPDRAEHDGDMADDDRTGLPDIIGSDREMEGRRRNGLVFPLEVSVARLDLDRHVLYSGIVRDVSQRKQHERDILAANAELEEFSYRTSHDLRSPIASSIGLVAILRDMIGLGATTSEISPVIERMETGLQKLDRLIETIIQLQRNRVLEEPTVAVPVAAAVRETIERLRFIGSGRQIAFTVDVAEDLVVVTKAARFQMILDNLVSNAIKYSDPGTTPQRVGVDAVRTSSGFELGVFDNGLGIDPRDETSLFQMFKRFHPGHSYGSGLGLYMLRKSAEHLDGTVVYRRLDKGSRFVVRLPQGDDA